MKRSEMVKILEEAVMDNQDYAVDTGPTCAYDVVLEELEKAGMLPPYNKNHGVDNYSLAMGVPTERTYNWEPEDE